MKNLKKILASATASTLIVLGVSMFALAPSVSAIQYYDNVPGLEQPGFNVFTGVPSFGNESDFLRGHVSGSSDPYTDPVNANCTDGLQFGVQVYVHNGANQTLNNNGTGPGVAHNTTVKVGVPGTTASNLTGTISASNAPSVNDTLKINCNGKTMQLSFVKGSALEQHMDGSTAPLSDSIVTTGAKVDTHGVAGDVWGCFEQRVIVYMKVEVKEAPKPPVTPIGVCKVTDVTVVDNDKRTVKATITPELSNGAKATAYRIDWGDGTTSNKQTDTHVYKGDGPYTVTGSVQIDGNPTWKTAENCKKTISFKPGEGGVTPTTPTSLPNTGAGNVVGIFAAVTVAGALFHRYFLGRKING